MTEPTQNAEIARLEAEVRRLREQIVNYGYAEWEQIARQLAEALRSVSGHDYYGVAVDALAAYDEAARNDGKVVP